MIASFELGSYALAAFLTLYGLVFFYVASNEPPRQNNTGKNGLVNPRLFFILFGLLYFALAHFTIFVALGYNIEYGTMPECENVVVASNYVNASYTQYTYNNSCAGTITPPATETLFTVYSWLLWIDLIALAIGSFFLFLRMVSKW